MPLESTINVAPDRVSFVTSGQFTPEEGVRVLQAALDACALNDRMYALIDVTGITQPYMATEKLIFAHHAEEVVSHLSKMDRAIPRIAIFGTTPFITIYKPASDHFQLQRIPIRVFDDLSSAEEWLFAADT
jgi:hypothetical protein